MNLLMNVVKQIVMCVFISNIVELLVSSEVYIKYIKLFMGLLLIIRILSIDIKL